MTSMARRVEWHGVGRSASGDGVERRVMVGLGSKHGLVNSGMAFGRQRRA